jgi:hypothetical protein
MNRRAFNRSTALAGLGLAAAPSGAREDEPLDLSLDAVGPGLKKWASVCVVTRGEGGRAAFSWHDYRGTANQSDFWPASTIKLYAVMAALELLAERGFPLDTTVTFEHREKDGRWVLDCARTVREMLSETFRRSSNEDYTLLLRLVGIDRLNASFLTPERGFERSALMRGYMAGRPWTYVREEPQRIRFRSVDGVMSETREHTWSGRFYAEERGATVIDAKTGNVTTPRDLVECLRRVLYHEHLPASEQYRLTAEQLAFLRAGGDGLTGLETRDEASGPTAWTAAVETVFPKARFFHKCGVISNFALEIAGVDDTANGGPAFVFAPVISAGSATKPDDGEKLVGQMSLKIAEWVRARHLWAESPAALKPLR